MCNHSYTPNRKASVSAEKQCPYPDLFKSMLSVGQGESLPSSISKLPIDQEGICLFHSQAIQWKRDNNFTDYFFKAMRWLETDDSSKSFDFSEFTIIGPDPTHTTEPTVATFRLADITFRKDLNFRGASFFDAVEIVDMDFVRGVQFDKATFNGKLTVTRSRFGGLGFSGSRFRKGAFFSKILFRSYCLFDEAQFKGTKVGRAVVFIDSTFQDVTSFAAALFDYGYNSLVLFENIHFEHYLDFADSEFYSRALFQEVRFSNTVEFKNTVFGYVETTARFHAYALQFDAITISATGEVNFSSTDPMNKLFNHDVGFDFKEQPEGKIHFENVNFHRIAEKSRDNLRELEKVGVVSIGPGCIKYRLQTSIRTLAIDSNNASLVIELCQTFTNYFSAQNGINLGFEVINRTHDEIRFFYFTDEDITKEVFLDRLARTERDLWDLISARPDLQQLGQGTTAPSSSVDRSAPPGNQENSLINAVDAISAMLGTFFRVSVRVFYKSWSLKDTQRLLQAVHFGENGSPLRLAPSLHQAITDKYSHGHLANINAQQHIGLLPMPATAQTILFLGVMPSDTGQLAMHREAQEIGQRLRSADLRGAFRLEQQWEVRADQLPGLIMRFKPQILHFCGHGQRDGELTFLDSLGFANTVDKTSIAKLFELLAETIECVVLNACFSAVQAELLAAHVDAVIGLSQEVENSDAIAFAAAFYEALAYGKDVDQAFELAKIGLDLAEVPSTAVPKLYLRKKLETVLHDPVGIRLEEKAADR